MKIRLFVVLYVISSTGAVAAEEVPVEVSLTENPAAYVTLGKLVVAMEGTTLKQLATTVGIGVVFSNDLHAHDGGGDEVCFQFGNAAVHFISNREFGGMNRQITNFRLEVANKPDARCSKLPASLEPVRVVGRLALGESREVVERRFNSIPGKSDAPVSYRFAAKVPGSCAEEGYDVVSWLEVNYSSNRITRMIGGQTSSC